MDISSSFRRAPIVALCIAITAFSAARAADTLQPAFPQSFRATFVLNALDVDIATTQWELAPLSNGSYSFSSHSEAIGIAKFFRDERVGERSEWQLSDGRVRPLRYFYSRAGGKRDREVQVEFDWDKARVRNTLNGNSWTMPLANGTLDKLVYVIAMMNDLAGGMREVRYAVADGGKTKYYLLKVVGDEQIDTILGPLQTTIVERSRKDKTRLTRIWCADLFNFLPVRLEHIEDDGTVQVTLTALEGFGLQ